MWMNFLQHNGGMEYVNDKWNVTEKGSMMILKYAKRTTSGLSNTTAESQVVQRVFL
jgi:hypothetical protein